MSSCLSRPVSSHDKWQQLSQPVTCWKPKENSKWRETQTTNRTKICLFSHIAECRRRSVLSLVLVFHPSVVLLFLFLFPPPLQTSQQTSPPVCMSVFVVRNSTMHHSWPSSFFHAGGGGGAAYCALCVCSHVRSERSGRFGRVALQESPLGFVPADRRSSDLP